MERKNLTINDTSISYLIQGDIGPYIIFLHGNSLSSDSFLSQFQDQRLQEYRLIAIDFPGHGLSQPGNDTIENYNLFYFRDLILSFVKELNIDTYILAGHSLGGHVAMECLPYASNCKGLMLWGAPPVTLPLDTSLLFKPDPRVALLFKSNLSSSERHELASLLTLPEHTSVIEKMLEKTVPAFREIFPISLFQGLVSDEFQLLNASGLPVAILHGSKDELVNFGYYTTLEINNLWKGEPLLLENIAHSPQIESPELFNNLIIQFSSDIFQVDKL